MSTKNVDTTIYIEPIKREMIEVLLLGKTELICNSLSEKTRQELLNPHGRLTTAEKQSHLKHNPPEEYRNSVNVYQGTNADVFIGILASAVKKAMMTAALDKPGAKKAQIGRLVRVEGFYLPIYGIPKLLMMPTRSSDMNYTPDIRTRAIISEWVIPVKVSFNVPILNATGILNLLNSAGDCVGLGDGRQEKGTFSFGLFEVAQPDSEKCKSIMKAGNKAAQLNAFENIEFFDTDSAKLFDWWSEQVKKSGKKI